MPILSLKDYLGNTKNEEFYSSKRDAMYMIHIILLYIGMLNTSLY